MLAGLFGKGGAAIATPLLHAVGVPAIVAVASPLPATIPSTLIASAAYWNRHLVDRRVVVWSLAFGVPATAAGALATNWIGGGPLIVATDVIVALLGLRFLCFGAGEEERPSPGIVYRARLAAVATVVGLASGLLANSGGLLLAPLFVLVLGLPLKVGFACSLAVAAVLAVPGTIIHAALGHIDWSVVLVFGLASVPCSYLGARLGVRTESRELGRVYGAVLTILGIGLLIAR